MNQPNERIYGDIENKYFKLIIVIYNVISAMSSADNDNKSCPARQQSSPVCVCVCVCVYQLNIFK